MRFKTIAILAALCIALAVPARSQTYTIDQTSCGAASSPLYCYGVPATLSGATDASTTLWIDLKVVQNDTLVTTGPGNGYQFVYFLSGDLAPLGTAHIDTYFAATGPVVSGSRTATEITALAVGFSGTGYSGTLTLNFSYAYSGGSGRGGGGAGWKQTITVGGLSVFTQASRLETSKPKKIDAALSWNIHPRKLFGQYGYSECNGVSPVAGPFYGGNGYWCEVYKGYCPVTQLGNQWQWVYWTDCASY